MPQCEVIAIANQKGGISDKKDDSKGEQSNSNNQSKNFTKPNNSSPPNSSTHREYCNIKKFKSLFKKI